MKGRNWLGKEAQCAAAVIEAGQTDCDIMASVIWEWFGEN